MLLVARQPDLMMLSGTVPLATAMVNVSGGCAHAAKHVISCHLTTGLPTLMIILAKRERRSMSESVQLS